MKLYPLGEYKGLPIFWIDEIGYFDEDEPYNADNFHLVDGFLLRITTRTEEALELYAYQAGAYEFRRDKWIADVSPFDPCYLYACIRKDGRGYIEMGGAGSFCFDGASGLVEHVRLLQVIFNLAYDLLDGRNSAHAWEKHQLDALLGGAQ